MMNTRKSQPSSSAPKFSSKQPSSFYYLIYNQDHSYFIWGFYIVIFLTILGLFILSVAKTIRSGIKSTRTPSPLDNKLVVGRFKQSYNIWNNVASDPMLIVLVKTLMGINSNSAIRNGYSDIGSKEIYTAYDNLDRYVKQNMLSSKNVRLTFMYNDGIVFYDSSLKISDVFFMKDGLPRPVSLYTLGSPLKDHNVLPEVVNSLVVVDSSDNRLSGMLLTDPFYRKLVNEGYGFVERISSTFNKPFSYVAHVLQLGVDPATGFVDTATLRVGIPIEPKT